MAAALWLTVVGVTLTAASAACPSEEWILNDGNCYWEAPFHIEWHSGEFACHTEFPGSHMVSIHDYIENAFVFERLGWNWLGLTQPKSSDPWHWTDGSAVNWTNWCPGQPEGTGELFAWLHQPDNGCWRTAELAWSSSKPLVCKVPEQD